MIFVAFDLEETGGAGSLAFIYHVLYTEVLEPAGWPAVQGAFILDTVMNYNRSAGAQSVPFAWLEQVRGRRGSRKGGQRGGGVSSGQARREGGQQSNRLHAREFRNKITQT